MNNYCPYHSTVGSIHVLFFGGFKEKSSSTNLLAIAMFRSSYSKEELASK